jgi:hypothetical protein
MADSGSSPDEGETGGARADRGAPLVATPRRWAVGTLSLAVGLFALAQTYISLWSAPRELMSFAGPIAITTAVFGVFLWLVLRGEELRLARQLRVARTGSSAIRAMVTRRGHGSGLTRLFSTRVGVAAVLLADGERAAALALLRRGSPLLRGGRLDGLHRVLEADLERALEAKANLERAIERLAALPPIGNREADLYRTHVLVKAVLELGDPDKALEVADALQRSEDGEERVYVLWLRTWFELDGKQSGRDRVWPAPSEGELRMATLLARAHGAEKLVERLEERVAAIAHPVAEK